MTSISFPRPKLTNTEFIDDLMNFSPYGALAQVFILQAIIEFSKQVSEAPLASLDSPLVNPTAWQGVAKDILARYAANYQEL